MPISLGRHNPGFLTEALQGYGGGDVWRTQLQQTTAYSTAPNPPSPSSTPNSVCVVLISEVMNLSGPLDLKISPALQRKLEYRRCGRDVDATRCIGPRQPLTNIKEPGTLSSCIRLTFTLLKVTLCHSFLHWQTTALYWTAPTLSTFIFKWVSCRRRTKSAFRSSRIIDENGNAFI